MVYFGLGSLILGGSWIRSPGIFGLGFPIYIHKSDADVRVRIRTGVAVACCREIVELQAMSMLETRATKSSQ